MVGIPDERYGEVIAAFVIRAAAAAATVGGIDASSSSSRAEEEENELREWVREKLSAHLGEYDPLLSVSTPELFNQRTLSLRLSIL